MSLKLLPMMPNIIFSCYGFVLLLSYLEREWPPLCSKNPLKLGFRSCSCIDPPTPKSARHLQQSKFAHSIRCMKIHSRRYRKRNDCATEGQQSVSANADNHNRPKSNTKLAVWAGRSHHTLSHWTIGTPTAPSTMPRWHAESNGAVVGTCHNGLCLHM